jgi:hypothetical protein
VKPPKESDYFVSNAFIICLNNGCFGMEIRKKMRGKFEFVAAADVELRVGV